MNDISHQKVFRDRGDAGRRLASLLLKYGGQQILVLALPRGGVPVGFEIAQALKAPLQVFVVRKLGAPGQPELGLGAVAQGGVVVFNESIVHEIGVTEPELEEIIAREKAELDKRVAAYGAHLDATTVAGRTIIVVDDGLATGGTASAALSALRTMRPARLVLAVPVAAAQTVARLSPLADEIVSVVTTENLSAVGLWYDNFEQTSDSEVAGLLSRGVEMQARPPGQLESTSPVLKVTVRIPSGGSTIEGDLVIPEGAVGLVLFAHGSGSSRHSSRNRYVADLMNRAGLGTLLVDLLTAEEEQGPDFDRLKFDIPFLARRLTDALAWLKEQEATTKLPVGLFGASTGAGAALLAAAERQDAVRAVVSRGGRPDLAGPQSLASVVAPTLLIVGGEDKVVLDLNRRARRHLVSAHSEIHVVGGATHLFEEPGALDQVASLASGWFVRYLARHE